MFDGSLGDRPLRADQPRTRTQRAYQEQRQRRKTKITRPIREGVLSVNPGTLAMCLQFAGVMERVSSPCWALWPSVCLPVCGI
jgi:hypothetical protein